MVCSMLNKLKKYQLGLVGAGTPTVFLMEALGLVDEATVQAFAGFGNEVLNFRTPLNKMISFINCFISIFLSSGALESQLSYTQ